MDKVKVMIVEDSVVVRALLESIIGQDPRLAIVASLGSAEEALAMLNRVSPDVISMDIRLPGMDGIEATRRIMAEKPTPIVVVSASVDTDELKISLNALRAGALAVVEKPLGPTHASYQAMAKHICSQLFLMSDVKVVRRHAISSRRPAETKRPAPLGPFRMLGIVASTGGPQALAQVLGGLPKDFPVPVAVVQHIVPAFLAGFASWLKDVCPFDTSIAKHGEHPLPGIVYVAPPGTHLSVHAGRFRLIKGEPVSYQCPSGTVLFQGMAQSYGAAALGVLLTGMGDDGAQGLLELREAKGYTIAEDISTAVVYGMPDKAVKLGAVCESLPVHAIANRLLKLLEAP
jgi:two-component system, chemotaxis family, protein-glutamate methylesterase/glutaminase